MIANALNCPLHLTSDPEITARGTAILALRAIVKSDLASYPPAIETVIYPRDEHVGRMAAARQRQVDLYNKTVADAD
jgi:sugar (pentulose or hexulose) kinase